MNDTLDPDLGAGPAAGAVASSGTGEAPKEQSASEEFVFVVPAEAQLTLALPDLSEGHRGLARVLAALSPLPLREVAWTHPFMDEQGQACVILVRRSYLDRETGALAPARQHRLVVRTAAGQRLIYAPPAVRKRLRVTLAIVAACALVSLTALIATGGRSDVRPALQAKVASAFGPVFARPGMLRSLAAASQGAVPGAALTAIASGGLADTPSLVAEYAVADPDLLRAAMGSETRELGQSRLAEGGYLVSLAIPAATTGRSAQPVARAEVLSASDGPTALRLAEGRLRGLARAEVLQIALTQQSGKPESLSIGLRTIGPQANVLRFVDAVEGGSPAMRFAEWRLARDPAGVALSGTLLVPVNRTP